MRILKYHTAILAIIFCFLFCLPAFAEIQVFEKEVEEAVSRGQSQEQVEAFALQKAKRLAVEEAGTYISSLTVVMNYQLEKDEVTALASGVVQAKVVGIPAVRVEGGVVHVKVKARIDVDTSVLDSQIKEIMKEKGTLKKLEAEQKKVRELEEKLTNLKSSEVKRLEELNAQALAVERERERQRLFREEQALKARGELSKAEADRIAKEREIQERINRELATQEKVKREEAAALEAEKDRIRKASLENEQRWNDLSRRAKLAQESWVAIDDSLSLKQATEEVKALKAEVANLKKRLDYQYQANISNLKNAYAQQRALTGPKMPPVPAPKDAFESSAEYNNRMADYKRKVKEAEAQGGKVVEQLQKEEALKLAEAKVDYLGQQIRVLTAFVERLKNLQARQFTLPEGGAMTVALGAPDADNNRFPVQLQYSGKSWSVWWEYKNRNSAKDFYNTRSYLKAEGLFQVEEAAEISPKLTTVRVTHLGTNESRIFLLENIKRLNDINQFQILIKEKAAAMNDYNKTALSFSQISIINKDDRFIAYANGTVLDTHTNLMWAAGDNGDGINWKEAKLYCENYQRGGYSDWRMPTTDEMKSLYDESKSRESKCFWRNHHPSTDLIQFSCHIFWTLVDKDGWGNHYTTLSGTRGHSPYTAKYRVLPVRAGK